MTSRRQLLLFIAKLGCSGLLLWLVLSRLDTAGIAARLRTTNSHWLLPALGLSPAIVLLSAWRWRVVSLGLLGLGEAVRYTWIGFFFGSVVPGLVGGDVAKGLSLAAKDPGVRDSRLPMSIVVDKLVGFWVLLFLFNIVGLIMITKEPQLLGPARNAVWSVGILTLAGLIAGTGLCHARGAIFFNRLIGSLPLGKLRTFGEKIGAALGAYSGNAAVLRRAVLISGVLHVVNAFSLWLVLRSLAIPASPWFAAVFYPMLSVLLALPVSISGVGVRDVFAAGMFRAFGLEAETGIAFSWLLLGLGIPNALIGAGIQLTEMFHRSSSLK
ncbi:MAG TPA: lysylphosphatidylglycerol synthase transmembrane domain-containing protein [Opitutaceae bacterium]|nr:lysylphosphatidylglycerol synthase transmembrane domain-containing protein [Opitutaceae bacterium]